MTSVENAGASSAGRSGPTASRTAGSGATGKQGTGASTGRDHSLRLSTAPAPQGPSDFRVWTSRSPSSRMRSVKPRLRRRKSPVSK